MLHDTYTNKNVFKQTLFIQHRPNIFDIPIKSNDYILQRLSRLLIKESRANIFSSSRILILVESAKFSIDSSISIFHPRPMLTGIHLESENFKQSADAAEHVQPRLTTGAMHTLHNSNPSIARAVLPAFVPGYRVYAKYPCRVLLLCRTRS